jgi:hypothetical protein
MVRESIDAKKMAGGDLEVRGPIRTRHAFAGVHAPRNQGRAPISRRSISMRPWRIPARLDGLLS